MLTLKNDLAVPTTKSPKEGDEQAAVCEPDFFQFGSNDGTYVGVTGTSPGTSVSSTRMPFGRGA
jgi:hypothetical protein